MEQGIKNKKIIRLILIVLILIILPVAVYVALTRQNIQKHAAGSGEVNVFFTPSSGTKAPGQTFTVEVKMQKTVARSIPLAGAEAVIEVGNEFHIVPNSAACVAPFNALPFVNVSGQTITVMCAVAVAPTPSPMGIGEISFARFDITVDNTIADGTIANLTFSNTRATEYGISGQAPDVSTSGTDAAFTIQEPVISSTPPAPSETETPLPSETPEPTLTPTPINSCESEGGECSWCPACTFGTPACALPCFAGICTNGYCQTVSETPTLGPSETPPAETDTPAPLPTSVTCTPLSSSLGNANGDCVIDANDFTAWVSEYTGAVTSNHADFNGDGKEDLVDYEIWRRNAH